MAQIIVQIEGEVPVVHELTDGTITIGRESDNTIVVPDPSVSRRHAEIPASDGPRTLRDLNSANGTAVNGFSIAETLLKPGMLSTSGPRRRRLSSRPRPPHPRLRSRLAHPRR